MHAEALSPSPAPPAAAAAGQPPRLDFSIEGAEAPRFTAAPSIRLDLRVAAPPGVELHSLLLECQVRIAPRRRAYPDPGERERLTDLFGPEEQWGRSLEGLLWTTLPLFVPSFRDSTQVGLELPCTYDFEVSAARYLTALAGGAVPIEVLFSGTVFWAGEEGRQRVARLPLDREAAYELPLARWREAIDRHFPGGAWLRCSRDRFARLQAYRAREALPSWDAVLDSLLEGREEGSAR